MSRIEEALRRAGQGTAVAVESADERHSADGAHGMLGAREPDLPPSPPRDVAPAGLATSVLNAALRGKLIVGEDAEPHAVEEYRKLAATLYQVQAERSTRVVMISSAAPGEGKSLTAANLALTLGESFHRRVLLIDADLRRPSIHEIFGIDNTAGLNDVLRAGHDAKLRLVEHSEHLTVLPAGPPNADPMGALTSERMQRIIEEASAKFEWVVIDTPPVGLLPDANLLAEMADMIVLVVGAGTTPYQQVQRAVEAFDRSRIAGVVLNRVAKTDDASHYYGYYSGRSSR